MNFDVSSELKMILSTMREFVEEEIIGTIIERLEPYPVADIQEILERAARRLQLPLHADAATLLAARSRGVPRLGLRILLVIH